jgi:hypothetical protein
MLQDGHSSGPRITAGLKRPTRRLWRAEPARVPGEARRLYQEIPPYLVLLRVGFAMPAALLRRRCALTAPFHPYLSLAARAVYFLWHFPSNDPAHKSAGALPDVIRHTALRSSDFPPVFRRATVRSGCQQFIIVQTECRQSAGNSADNSEDKVQAPQEVQAAMSPLCLLLRCEKERINQQRHADQ